MIHKFLNKLGLADEYGYCDMSIVGFIVIWSFFLYGAYLTVMDIFK
jgi:hypothetical protein